MICQGCERDLPESVFPERKDNSGRKRPYCPECKNRDAKARYDFYRRTSPFKHKATRAKSRSQHLKVPYDLDADYLESIWTDRCPVLGTEIFINEKSRTDESAAELDRIVPERGYVKGNVAFLSRRANRLKNNVTSEELHKLYLWLKDKEDNGSNTN